jgi:hypothetical protein
MATTVHNPRALIESSRFTARSALVAVLVAVVVAGLAIDAYIHFDLASNYAPIKTSVISQAGLFRIEAVVSIAAALALLLRPRRYTAAIAFVVTASALAALIVTRYYDIGTIGPIPDMYEPVWFTEKLIAAYAEAAAAIAAIALVVTLPRRHSTPDTSTDPSQPIGGHSHG